MNQLSNPEENSDLMVKFLNKELTPEEEIAFRQQINNSNEEQELLKNLIFINEATDAIGFNQTSHLPDAEKKIRKKLNKTKRITGFKNSFVRIAAILTIPLLCSTIYLLYQQFHSEQTVTMNEITGSNKYASTIKLSDGSTIHLRTGSTLRYPDRFNKNERMVEIDGEGFFEVQSDPKNPFYVILPDQSKVKVYGTKFNVCAYQSDSLLSVFLESGHVDVITHGNQQTITLEPKMLLTYNVNSKQLRMEQRNPNEYTEWVNGKIIFNNTPINEVAERLSRHFGVNVEIGDKRLNKCNFKATFQGETIYQILNMLKLSTPGFDWTIKQRSDSLDGKQTIILSFK